MKAFSLFGVLSFCLCTSAFADPVLESENLATELQSIEPLLIEPVLIGEEIEQEISTLSEEIKQDEESLNPATETDVGLGDESVGEELLGTEVAKGEEQKESLPVISTQVEETPALLQVESEEVSPVLAVNLQKAFSGSPTIYLILLVLSVAAVSIWLYSLISLRKSSHTPDSFLKTLQSKMLSNQFDEALVLCNQNADIFSKMIACGIHCRGGARSSLVEAMQAEGKRNSIHFWQRIGLLNDIAIVAPMIGLLGTVLGMFYAFYDINRSIESITTLFDGLGVSVGTTVAGLVVAILALVLHSTAKYRLVRTLAKVDHEAHAFAALLHDKTA